MICKFIHNSEAGTWFGTRDAAGWRKILGFYFCFYGLLTLFWALCFSVMEGSLRGGREGPLINNLSPQADVDTYAVIQTGWIRTWPDGTRKEFTLSDSSTYTDEIEEINEIFTSRGNNVSKSYFTTECGSDYGYNSSSTQICVLARMNRVFYQPKEGSSPKSVTCTLDYDDNQPEKALTVVGYNGVTATGAAFAGDPFLNQPYYTDPIVAIKIDLTGLLPIDNKKVNCDADGVQVGNFWFRLTVKA